jgi:hypothetical protein
VISVTAPLELAAAGRTSGSADMHLSGHEGVTVRTLKVETPNLKGHVVKPHLPTPPHSSPHLSTPLPTSSLLPTPFHKG